MAGTRRVSQRGTIRIDPWLNQKKRTVEMSESEIRSLNEPKPRYATGEITIRREGLYNSKDNKHGFEDRRIGSTERRVGKPDTRKNKVERRK